jgi:methionyl-tRNA formyltransferase
MGSPPLAATILDALCTRLYPPELVVTQIAKAAGRGQKIVPTAVEEYAKRKGIEVISCENVNTPEIVDRLRAVEPELVLVAAFGQILRQDILTLPKRYCLNMHGSLLPKYRGAAPIQRAIWNGDPITGVTVQKMARKLDTGDIFLRLETPIGRDETSGELMARLAVLGGEAFVEAVRKIERGDTEFTPQVEAEASYAAKLTREEAVLDWAQPAERILNQLRALQPWPVAETTFAGGRLKVFRAELADGKDGAQPGDILTDGKTRLAVQCGDGRAVALTEIQPENRKRLNNKDFLNSFRGPFPARMGPHQQLGAR